MTTALHQLLLCLIVVPPLLCSGVNGYVVPLVQSPTPNNVRNRKSYRWIERDGDLTRKTMQRTQQSSNNNGDYTTSQTSSNGDAEPDLFDYFDPLLSPHAYPKGIGAPIDNKIKSLVRYDDDIEQQQEELVEEVGRSVDAYTPMQSLNSDDLGWGSSSRSDVQKKSYQLKKPFGISLPGSDDEVIDKKEASLPMTDSTELRNIDTSNIFDPTLSPHFYTKGSVPDVIIGDGESSTFEINSNNGKSDSKEMTTIGILLMDHGSRNPASNERLHELAKLYQHQFATSVSSPTNKNVRVVVKAAHMEIALPSIEDGLSALIQENVQEIICHPYFLSPGRHVVEDIPQIVKAAIETLSISIPVKTTRPIGSETNIMINAINSLVNETSDYLQ